MGKVVQQSLFGAEPMQGEIERAALASGFTKIVGVDEAGRGPLAGPVYAAAVVLDLAALDQPWITRLDDSKKLTERDREELFDAIQQGALAWHIAARDAEVIDEINILQATLRAMEECIEAVAEAVGGEVDAVYIDGNQRVQTTRVQRTVVKGDGRSRHIAAASILAKVARDRMMVEQAALWPEYGFAGHKGYASKAHMAAIAEHGPCILHRRTFAGVREHIARLRLEPGEPT
jgi:ribonuclease HII